MKKQLLFLWILFLLCAITPLTAQTNVSGIISSNTNWTLAGSPYRITAHTEIPSGVTLTIQPGVKVIGTSNLFTLDLLIKGAIICNGKPDSLIEISGTRLLFKSTNLSMSQFSFTKLHLNGSLFAAKLQISEESIISQDTVKNFGKLSISNMTFSMSQVVTQGYNSTASLEIVNSNFSDNTLISTIAKSEPITIINSEIQKCSLKSGALTTLKYCTVSNTYFTASCCGTNFKIMESKLIHSGFDGGGSGTIILFSRTLLYKCGTYMPSSGIEAKRCVFINDLNSVKVCFSLYSAAIDSSSFVGYDQNTLFNFMDWNTPATGGSAVFNHCTFSNHIHTIAAQNIKSLSIRNSNFNLNKYSVFNQSKTNIDARSNWWGTTDQSMIDESIWDTKDSSIYGSVDYSGFLNTFDTVAPITAPVAALKRAINGGVEYSWAANKELDIAGYKIYTDSLTEYSFANSINVGNVNTYFIPSASIHDNVALTAYDNEMTGTNDQIEGHESWFANFKTAGFINLDTAYCLSPGFGFDLMAEPSGGTFSGPGITGTYFDVSSAGPGQHKLFYIYLNPGTNKNDTVTAVVSIYAPPVAGTLTANQTTFCAGSRAQLTLSGYNGSTFEWQTDSGGVFVTIPGAISSAYITAPLNASSIFRVIVRNGICDPQVSNQLGIAILPNEAYIDTITLKRPSICLGDSATLKVLKNVGTIQWQASTDSLQWTNVIGATDSIFNTKQIKIKTYYRAIATIGGCASDTSNIRSVSIDTLPPNQLITLPPGSTNICRYGSRVLVAPLKPDGFGFFYIWKIDTTQIMGEFSSSYWPNKSGIYTVRIINTTTGCENFSNPLALQKIDLGLAPPPICIVGVDSLSKKNSITWEKPLIPGIDSFYIYKKNDLSRYERIGRLAYASESKFIDLSSNPNVQAESYKISIVDSCGNETTFSNFHQTIYLQLEQGAGSIWKLSWNAYQGTPVSYYRIYRGNAASTMRLMGTATAGNNSFTDYSAPSAAVLYYQIEAVNPKSCTPGFSKSNVVTNDPNGIANYTNSFSNIEVYPVPNKGSFTVDFYSNSTEKANMKIVNVLGEAMVEENNIFVHTGGQSKTITLENVAKGIYFLSFQSKGGVFIRKIIVE